MLRNYITVAIRNIVKQKFYSIINILGLTAGIAATLFIIIYLKDELGYDRFHEKIDRMYRVGLHGRLAGQDVSVTSTPPPMAFALVSDIPEISDALRLWEWGDVVVRYEDKSFTEDRVFHTDSNFFRFFSFRLLEGDQETALKEPNSIVLTESMAQKFFAPGERLGKIIIFSNDNKAMKVTGIAEDPPGNSHIKFNYLVSFSSNDFGRSDQWLSNSLNTYFVTHEKTETTLLENKINDLIPKYVGPQLQQFLGITIEQFIENDGAYGYLVDEVKDIHLHSRLYGEMEPPGDIAYIYIFGAIGFFILVIAAINFMNLSTAKSSGRAREVGMRKTFGSQKSQLIAQFLIESMIYSIVAVLLAFILVILLLPQFNMLSGKILKIESLFNPQMALGVLILVVLVGLLSGSYPAFYLTRFKIAEVFKGQAARGSKSGWIRGSLVVLQFAISILLIISTIIVYNQMQYTQNKNLGFDKENVIVLSNVDRLGNNRQAFKDALMKDSNIRAASYSNSVIPGVNNTTIFRKPGTEEDHIIGLYFADHEHFDVMGFELAEGRNFSRDFPSDTLAILVNESVVKEMGWEDPIGEKLISFNGPQPEELNVVGVLKDFNFESLRDNIRPLLIRLGNFGNDMTVRVNAGDPGEHAKTIEKIWNELAPNEPFQFTFLDENFNALYRAELRIGKLLTIFTILAIFIASLGLFGLAAFTAEQRTREIGIRKAMGASSFNIVSLLSAEFVKFVGIAFVLAVVPAWFLISDWLENFVYRIEINYLIFILGGISALVIALLTVSYQSIKAAAINPAETLRYE